MTMRRRKKRHDRRFLYRWLNPTVGLSKVYTDVDEMMRDLLKDTQ